MRIWVAALIFLVLSSAGCTKKERCKEVIEEAQLTEIEIESIPVKINYTGPIKDIRIVSNRVQVPLNYTTSDLTSGAGRFFEINKTGYYSDLARDNQIVTAYVTLTVTNNDSVGGNFTLNWTYNLGQWLAEQREVQFIEPHKNKTFRLEFNMTRGENWSYGYNVIPGTKELNLPYAVYEAVDDVGERIILMYNRSERTVIRNVTRQIC